MRKYTPDCWVIVTFTYSDSTTADRILAGWYGGYTGGDSWQLSSGITEVQEYLNHWEVLNVSGSVYILYKNAKGMSGYTNSIFSEWEKAVPNENVSKIVLNDKFLV